MRYELMIILKPLLPEDVKSKLVHSVETNIKELGGKVLQTDIWGKRHLAYPINKHEEGYYMIYQIELPRSNVRDFDEKLSLTNGVLRFLRTVN
jgi:small subunit ribosomal protein S6